MSDFSRADLETARDRLYPHWWVYGSDRHESDHRPQYRVAYSDAEELRLAQACKPTFVDADYFHRS